MRIPNPMSALKSAIAIPVAIAVALALPSLALAASSEDQHRMDIPLGALPGFVLLGAAAIYLVSVAKKESSRLLAVIALLIGALGLTLALWRIGSNELSFYL